MKKQMRSMRLQISCRHEERRKDMDFTCTIKEYEALNNMCLKEASDLKILFSFTWSDGRTNNEKACVLFLDEIPESVRGFAVSGLKNGYEYTIVLNNTFPEDTLHRALKHEIEHIAYRDFESLLTANEIEAIRHSAIGNNIKKEYRSIDSMKKGT